jgi:hypothetical protein
MAVCSGTGIQAADLIYSMTGGALSGTLNGVPFANAGYSITATADPALIQSYTILGAVPADYLLATTTIAIDGFAPVFFTDLQFGIASANINAVSAGNSIVGFASQLGTDTDTGLGPVGAGSPLSLSAPGSFSGDLITFTGLASPGAATWTTTGGTLTLSGVAGTATISITAVPEPSSIILGGLATGIVVVTARRRRTVRRTN